MAKNWRKRALLGPRPEVGKNSHPQRGRGRGRGEKLIPVRGWGQGWGRGRGHSPPRSHPRFPIGYLSPFVSPSQLPQLGKNPYPIPPFN